MRVSATSALLALLALCLLLVAVYDRAGGALQPQPRGGSRELAAVNPRAVRRQDLPESIRRREGNAAVQTGLGEKTSTAIGMRKVTRENSGTCSTLDPAALIYNRIPKTGSTTMLNLFNKLQKRSMRYTYVHSMNFGGSDYTGLRPYFRAIASEDSRTLYDRHQRYLTGIDGSIAWVNLVREPGKRESSYYYYMRYSPELGEARKRGARKKYGDATFDECIARPPNEWRECGIFRNGQTRYFCGAVCEVTDMDEMLAIAKRNIEESFAIVGVLERLDDMLHLLEKRFPGYFTGMEDLKADMEAEKARNGAELLTKNRTPHPPASAETIERLKVHNRADYELYEWVVQRLDAQLAQCK